MDTQKQEFIKRYNEIKESVVAAMDLALKLALKYDVIDFNSLKGNYNDIYPLIGAVLEKERGYCIKGSLHLPTQREIRKKYNEYLHNLNLWYGKLPELKYKTFTVLITFSDGYKMKTSVRGIDATDVTKYLLEERKYPYYDENGIINYRKPNNIEFID